MHACIISENLTIFEVKKLLVGPIKVVQYTEDYEDVVDIYIGVAANLPERFETLEIKGITGCLDDVVIFVDYEEGTVPELNEDNYEEKEGF